MAIEIDRRAVARGVATYLAIAVPCALLIALMRGSDRPGHESNLWTAAAFIIIVVAPLVGGARAGGAQPTPLAHGALAIVVPAGLFLIVVSAVQTVQARMTATKGVTFLLYLVVFTAIGMLGGYLGFRRRQHLA